MRTTLIVVLLNLPALLSAHGGEKQRVFRDQVAPILERHCLNCHNDRDKKGMLSLQSAESAFAGGESGAVIVPGDADASTLLELITGNKPEMPQDAKPLSPSEVAIIRTWISDGANWPKDLRLTDRSLTDMNWWSLKPLKRPAVPTLSKPDTARVRTSIDRFVIAKLREKRLHLSPEADRRTLIRRLYFDLTGLPPKPKEIDAFVDDPDPQAYEKLVERLLDSPQYGERWARHWLDVVHYGETHGYDKDKPRMNAWPYRDYVIRSFNQDKPYARFVEEQIAGDALWPDTVDGIVATGFIAAGPWDYIGHAEVPETKIDGKVARHLDRDNMVTSTMNTFCSLTVQCARCHNHKLDPVTMEDYYSLQAVFAAIDRADREFDSDPTTASRRRELAAKQQQLESERQSLQKTIHELAGPQLAVLDGKIAELTKEQEAAEKKRPEFGYHSKIERRSDAAKWVQVDLGKSTKLQHVIIVGCHDTFNNIGAGFGFPVRFRIELSDDPKFNSDVITIADHTSADFPNPGVTPQSFPAKGKTGRYIRVTATKLVNRLPSDYIFALAELMALTRNGKNVASLATVTSLDSIEAPVRWRRSNLVDDYYYGASKNLDVGELAKLGQQRKVILDHVLTDAIKSQQSRLATAINDAKATMSKLPPKDKVYAGGVHFGSGSFQGRGGLGPRVIHVLHRGDVTQPRKLVEPGTVPFIAGAEARFKLTQSHDESDRRVALAKWITRRDNPLTWRSIANRVWLYHFGRGIIDSPNDFGRGGQLPSHPELLDWLAAEFRDGRQSIKDLHRLICNSAVYRQVSRQNESNAKIDGENKYLWRMNRRRLAAEEIRDSVLAVAGKLDTKMGGPSFMDFVIEQPAHSPHYEYDKYDPNDSKSHRRAIYRFIVRSQPQPFMNTLDCADPSMSVPKRDETLTALQALALLNNRFMIAMSDHFATRLKKEKTTPSEQLDLAYRLTIGRSPTDVELTALTQYAASFGLPNACRVILNLNEFVFVD